MKTSRIAALALIATTAIGLNAYAGETSPEPQPTQKFISTLSVEAVRAQAVQSTLELSKRGFNQDLGEFRVGQTSPTLSLSREIVRAEAIKASRTNMVLADSV